MRWIVQTNLGKQYAEDIQNACTSLGLEFIPQSVIPFSDELPDIANDKLTTFYGATRWINNIYENNKWTPGVFFNPESVCHFWLTKYREHAINYYGDITTFKWLERQEYPDDRMFFVRPCSDQKEFAGQVMSFAEIKDWRSKMTGDIEWLSECKILASEPVGIAHEWRLFIVDGKVSSGSHYRSYHQLQEDTYVPAEVIVFAEERAKDYSPTPVFVMDIGESAGNLYVVEIGCFHSAGFYASDVKKVIHDVSKYIEQNFS